MAKKIVKTISLQITAGKATPAPPIGPALGGAGLNIMGFCKDFNSKTEKMGTDTIPVVITVYSDKSFTFVLKQPPMSYLILKELGLEKGSAVPNRDKVGKLTQEQAQSIAKQKAPDLQAYSLEKQTNLVRGTAKSLGVEIVR